MNAATHTKQETPPRASAAPCILLCHSCRARLRTGAWHKVRSCPKCNGKHTALDMTFENLMRASPHTGAAQRRANALAALVAHWSECAGPVGVTRCMREQAHRGREGAPPGRLPLVMAKRGLLNPHQATALARYLTAAETVQHELRLIGAAAKAGTVDRKATSSLLAVRSEQFLQQGGNESLLALALQEGLLDEKQVKAALRAGPAEDPSILAQLQALAAEGHEARRAFGRDLSSPALMAGVTAAVAAALLWLLVF